jgi:protein-S-isoprenylcysteine O-methyltransferase Ste14
MNETIYKILFIIYAVALGLIRLPQHLKYGKKKGPRSKVSKHEHWTFPLAFMGMLVIPLVYIFTGWLAYFRMDLPEWARLCGPVIAFLGLVFLWWVHRTLGYHWSPISEIAEEHKLVKEGPYKYIRHPMYTAFYLLIIGAWLALSNWLVGIASFVSWSIFCSVRINMEEKMMIKEFGREYKEYIKSTGSLLPKFTR